jgi:hypothetical protein
MVVVAGKALLAEGSVKKGMDSKETRNVAQLDV